MIHNTIHAARIRLPSCDEQHYPIEEANEPQDEYPDKSAEAKQDAGEIERNI
jgi:hypothetical protein